MSMSGLIALRMMIARGEEGGEAQARAANELFAHQMANAHLPMRELPAGIFWERTAGNRHRVTIRRKPELVTDYSGMLQSGAFR